MTQKIQVGENAETHKMQRMTHGSPDVKLLVPSNDDVLEVHGRQLRLGLVAAVFRDRTVDDSVHAALLS